MYNRNMTYMDFYLALYSTNHQSKSVVKIITKIILDIQKKWQILKMNSIKLTEFIIQEHCHSKITPS